MDLLVHHVGSSSYVLVNDRDPIIFHGTDFTTYTVEIDDNHENFILSETPGGPEYTDNVEKNENVFQLKINSSSPRTLYFPGGELKISDDVNFEKTDRYGFLTESASPQVLTLDSHDYNFRTFTLSDGGSAEIWSNLSRTHIILQLGSSWICIRGNLDILVDGETFGIYYPVDVSSIEDALFNARMTSGTDRPSAENDDLSYSGGDLNIFTVRLSLSTLQDVDPAGATENQILSLGGEGKWVPTTPHLSQNQDVLLENLAGGDLLKYNGQDEVWEPGSLTLTELADVEVTLPTTKQVLQFDASSGQFKNNTLSLNLDDLADVSLGVPENGQSLTFQSATSKWVPSTPGISPDFSQVSTEDFRLTSMVVEDGILKGSVTFTDIAQKGVYAAVLPEPVEFQVHGNGTSLTIQDETSTPIVFYTEESTRTVNFTPSGYLNTTNVSIRDVDGNEIPLTQEGDKVQILVSDLTPEVLTIHVSDDSMTPTYFHVKSNKYLQFTASVDNYVFEEVDALKEVFGRDSSGRDYVSYNNHSIQYSHSDKFGFHDPVTGDDIARSTSHGWWSTDMANVSVLGTAPTVANYLGNTTLFPPLAIINHAQGVPTVREYFSHDNKIFYQTDVMNENYELDSSGQPQRSGSRKVYQSATTNHLIIYKPSVSSWRMLSESLPTSRPAWSTTPYYITKDGTKYNRYGSSFYYFEKTNFANTSKTLRTGGNKPLWRANNDEYWIWDVDETKWYKVDLDGNESSGYQFSLFKITAFSGESNAGSYPYYRPSGSSFTDTVYYGWFVSDSTGSLVSSTTSSYTWPPTKAKIPYKYLGNSTYPSVGSYRPETKYNLILRKDGDYPVYRNLDRSISLVKWSEDATRQNRSSLLSTGSGWLSMHGDIVTYLNGSSVLFRSRTLSESLDQYMTVGELGELYPVHTESSDTISYNNGTTLIEVNTQLLLTGLADVSTGTVLSNGSTLKYNEGIGKFEVVDDKIQDDSARENQVLRYTDSAWRPSDNNLENLSDALITSPAMNDIITYDSTTSRWKNADMLPQHIKMEGGVISIEKGFRLDGQVELRNLQTQAVLDEGEKLEISAQSGKLVPGSRSMYFDGSTGLTWIWSNLNGAWIGVNTFDPSGIIIQDFQPEWQVRYRPSEVYVEQNKVVLRDPINNVNYMAYMADGGVNQSRGVFKFGEKWYVSQSGTTISSVLWSTYDPLKPDESTVIAYSMEDSVTRLNIPANSSYTSRAWGDWTQWHGLTNADGTRPHVFFDYTDWGWLVIARVDTRLYGSGYADGRLPIFKHNSISNRFLVYVATEMHSTPSTGPYNGVWHVLDINWDTFRDDDNNLVRSELTGSEGNTQTVLTRTTEDRDSLFVSMGSRFSSSSYHLDDVENDWANYDVPELRKPQVATHTTEQIEGWARVTGIPHSIITHSTGITQEEFNMTSIEYLTSGPPTSIPDSHALLNIPDGFELEPMDFLLNPENPTLTYPNYENRFAGEIVTETRVELGDLYGVNLVDNPPAEGDVIQYLDGEWKNSNFLRTGDFFMSPTPGVTPVNNGEFTIRAASNNRIEFVLRGTDGVVRSAGLNIG